MIPKSPAVMLPLLVTATTPALPAFSVAFSKDPMIRKGRDVATAGHRH